MPILERLQNHFLSYVWKHVLSMSGLGGYGGEGVARCPRAVDSLGPSIPPLVSILKA